MPKTYLNCKAVALKDIPILSCGVCRSAVYCSTVCQKEQWKEHKKICKSLNVGEGAMQVRIPAHMMVTAKREDAVKETERSLDEDGKRFFKLFTQSTFEGSTKAAARKMKKIAARSTKRDRKDLLLHSVYILLSTDSEKLLWPNSQLLVLLQFFDPKMLLDHLAILADPTSIDYSTHENQLTLGRQLIEHGANVNTAAIPDGDTPLHSTCHSSNTTNLDFIQLLLENGADPNVQDHLGRTPLLRTIMFAPGAARFLLE
jgi:hypothetical protein